MNIKLRTISTRSFSMTRHILIAATALLMTVSVTFAGPISVAEAQELETAYAPDQRPDSDADGLDDGQEHYWSLDPYDYDTDGDGLGDGDEFYDRYARSDPSVYDSDYDGLSDGEEVYSFGTDPLYYDTDGDGRGDGEEVRYFGTDPRRPN